MVTKLEKLDKSAVEKHLGDYLTLTQIDGLMKRRQLLLDLVKELSQKFGERAVIYP
jgi:antitoxin component HigA of HigAB toxin-antitoxin module